MRVEQTPIQLLIVDDSLETCDILENYFALTPEIAVCGAAHDGEEALFRIGQCQPDVVLLDLIMPKTDGLSVLERLSRTELVKRPRIIVTSAVGQESFTAAALALGADYYMIKPYDMANLLSRICTAGLIGAARPAAAVRPQGMETQVSRALLAMGIPAHMRGYRYCITAAYLLMQEGRHRSIVKDVYAEVAREFDTTQECVEGAIRKAIGRGWRTQRAAMQTLTGQTDDRPPANGRFLIALTQRLQLAPEAQKGSDGDGTL